MNKTKRLFIAFNLPEEIRNILAAVIKEQSRPNDGINWVWPAGLPAINIPREIFVFNNYSPMQSRLEPASACYRELTVYEI